MRPALLLLWTIVSIAGAPLGVAAADDEQQLNQLLDRWIAARNANDASAMRDLFDPRMDQIQMTTGDIVASNRDGTVRWFTDQFSGSNQGSRIRVTRRAVRLLSEDSALIDFSFTIDKAGGSATQNVNVTYVCGKQHDEWRVVALRFSPGALMK